MSTLSCMGEVDARGAAMRVARGLRSGANWAQLARFCAVGASGYAVNLVVFGLALHFGMHYLPAAALSFLVAVTNNYIWNRLWTFRSSRGHVGYQGLRFLLVSTSSLVCNLVILAVLVETGAPELLAQAIAIALVTPLNFAGNKLWSFGR
jgi:putative flippase GtrA